MTANAEGLLPRLATRSEYFDFLDGHAVRSGDELYERHLTAGLAKTYMLETVPDSHAPVDVQATLSNGDVHLDRVGDDDRLFRVLDREQDGIVALVEVMNDRHPVLYTLLPVRDADPWVRKTVDSNPWLDRLWLSTPIFRQLWQHVRTTSGPQQFSSMTFQHEALYEADGAVASGDEEPRPEEGPDLVEADPEEDAPVGRRSSRFSMVDRVGVIADLLPALQSTYRPLASVVQLRIPSGGRGGHDFYFDGKVTNRSDTFLDHRQNVAYVLDLYRHLTDSAEQHLWVSSEEEGGATDAGFRLRGAPLYLRFSEPLGATRFDRWLSATFRRRGNRFRLSGYVFRLGPTKAHISAIDRHLWQPLLLQASATHIVAILPKGTCGNTVHRLVTNVQRYLDPMVEAWLGDEPYARVVQMASEQAGV